MREGLRCRTLARVREVPLDRSGLFSLRVVRAELREDATDADPEGRVDLREALDR